MRETSSRSRSRSLGRLASRRPSRCSWSTDERSTARRGRRTRPARGRLSRRITARRHHARQHGLPACPSRRAPAAGGTTTADATHFPQSILLATDGSPGSWAAARIATGLAKAKRSELRLVYVPDGMHPERYREVLKQLTVIEKATGSPPPVVDNPGHVAERIGEAARAAQSSLIVIGRRGVAASRRWQRQRASRASGAVFRAPGSQRKIDPKERHMTTELTEWQSILGLRRVAPPTRSGVPRSQRRGTARLDPIGGPGPP